MIAHIIDDLYDFTFLAELEYTLLEMPIHTTNVANPRSFPNGRTGSHRLFGTDVFVREGLNRVTQLIKEAPIFFDAFKIIEDEIFKDDIFLQRIDVNLQYFRQDGTGHYDGDEDHDFTVMLMNCCQWKPEWGGTTEYIDYNTGEPVHIDYKPGRLIVMKGNLTHRGNPPSDKYRGLRTSIIIKTFKPNDGPYVFK